MKKILLLIIALFFITGCGNSNMEKLSYSELNKKLDNKDSFVLFFEGNDDTLKNTLNSVLEANNLTGYTINTSKLDSKEEEVLRNKIDYDSNSIVFIIDGMDPSVLSHVTDKYTSKEDLITRLKDMGFIKENNN